MMQSIALNPALRSGDRPGPTARSRAVTVARRDPFVLSTGSPSSDAIVDFDDPRDVARSAVLALAFLAIVLATLLLVSTLQTPTPDVGAIVPQRTTAQSAPVFTSGGPTVSIPTGPALFVMLAHGQD